MTDIDLLAERVLLEAGCGLRAPVPLDVVAASLGVQSINTTALHCDGLVDFIDGAAHIYVSGRASPERQRFTIAHELGHLLLEEASHFRLDSPPTAPREVERFCQRFAAALLLPSSWVRKNDNDNSLESLIDVASSAQTSLSATFLRLRELRGWTTQLMQFRFRHDWTLEHCYGAFADVVRLNSDAGCRLSGLARMSDGSEPRRASLPVLHRGRPRTFEGQALARRSHIHMLGRFRPPTHSEP